MGDFAKAISDMDEVLFALTGQRSVYERYCGCLKLEDLFTIDSVYLAAQECACGMRNKQDTFAFMQDVWGNSDRLCELVLSGKFKPSYYKKREIKERGKIRIIKPPKFECKVVQKVLCMYLIRPLLEPKMIQTNYSSIKGRGTEKMYQDVLKGINLFADNPKARIVMTDFFRIFRID